jgi:hypothetical protein
MDRYFTERCATCRRRFSARALAGHESTHAAPTVGFDQSSGKDSTAFVIRRPGSQDETITLPQLWLQELRFSLRHDLLPPFGRFTEPNANTPGPERRTLRDEVSEQIGSLTAGLDGFEGRPELPRPPVDLTTYADAFASAAANCNHANAVMVLYGREWNCPDCFRIVGCDEMRGFGGWFG